MSKASRTNLAFSVPALMVAFWLTDGVEATAPGWYQHMAFVGVTLCVWSALALTVLGTTTFVAVVRNAWKTSHAEDPL